MNFRAPVLLFALLAGPPVAHARLLIRHPLHPRALHGDFNGDGRRDKASFVQSSDFAGLGLALHMGGPPALLGMSPGEWTLVEQDEGGQWAQQPEPWLTDLAVIEDWRLLPRQGDAIEIQVLGATQRLALPGLQGDAIYLSSSDAAIVVYWTASGWRAYELGF